MNKNIFEYNHYRPYFRDRLEAQRGSKAKIAISIGVQAAYISQVLQEVSHLSLEQAEAANIYFQHTQQESHYFLLMVQKDRAGTKSLREYFHSQLNDILKARMVLTERLEKLQQLDEKDRGWYYSSWIPAALHIGTTIPQLRTIEQMASAFHLPIQKITETLEQLEKLGLVKKEGLEFHSGLQQIRLGNNSHHILKHHTNWRLQAMQSLEREQLNELHYSAVVSLSSSDITKIKNILLESIQNSINIVKESKEEELFCLNMDFFNLRNI